MLCQKPDYATSAIESSKYWIDIDYAGDRTIGHKLDIHLPKGGQAPFPVIICIYGSAFFRTIQKRQNTGPSTLDQILKTHGSARRSC